MGAFFLLPPVLGSGIGSGGRGRGKKKAATAEITEQTLADNPMHLKMLQIWNKISTLTDESGREMSSPFVKLPARRHYADYYRVIKNPISLTKIKENIPTHTSWDTFVNEFHLLFDNAMAYNLPDSQIYSDARSMKVKKKKKHFGLIFIYFLAPFIPATVRQRNEINNRKHNHNNNN